MASFATAFCIPTPVLGVEGPRSDEKGVVFGCARMTGSEPEQAKGLAASPGRDAIERPPRTGLQPGLGLQLLIGRPKGALAPLAPGGLTLEALCGPLVLGVILCMSRAAAAAAVTHRGRREGGADVWARVSWLLAALR